MRVVSLVPSITETLLAWGITPVACSRFCEQPQLPHVGGTKDPDLDAIVALGPDLVLMDVEENRRPDAEALHDRGLTVHATHVNDLTGLGDELRRLAEAVGVAAEPLVLPPANPPAGRVTVLIWKRPWMALGTPTYGNSMLEWLGWSNVVTDRGPYPTVELAELAAAAPDLLILPSEPYPFAERHCDELERSVGASCRLVDGQDLLWWGSRTPAALARLAEVLGPSG